MFQLIVIMYVNFPRKTFVGASVILAFIAECRRSFVGKWAMLTIFLHDNEMSATKILWAHWFDKSLLIKFITFDYGLQEFCMSIMLSTQARFLDSSFRKMSICTIWLYTLISSFRVARMARWSVHGSIKQSL